MGRQLEPQATGACRILYRHACTAPILRCLLFHLGDAWTHLSVRCISPGAIRFSFGVKLNAILAWSSCCRLGWPVCFASSLSNEVEEAMTGSKRSTLLQVKQKRYRLRTSLNPHGRMASWLGESRGGYCTSKYMGRRMAEMITWA